MAITLRWGASNPAGVRDRLKLRKDAKGKATKTPSSIRETTDGSVSITGSTLGGCDVAGTRVEPSAMELFKSRIEMLRRRASVVSDTYEVVGEQGHRV